MGGVCGNGWMNAEVLGTLPEYFSIRDCLGMGWNKDSVHP